MSRTKPEILIYLQMEKSWTFSDEASEDSFVYPDTAVSPMFPHKPIEDIQDKSAEQLLDEIHDRYGTKKEVICSEIDKLYVEKPQANLLKNAMEKSDNEDRPLQESVIELAVGEAPYDPQVDIEEGEDGEADIIDFNFD